MERPALQPLLEEIQARRV